MSKNSRKRLVKSFYENNFFPPFPSEKAYEKLSLFAELLFKWNLRINLTAPLNSMADLERHFFDSFAINEHIPPETKTILDMGSGNGFPAIILAILGKNGLKTHLVDSNSKKTAFLHHVSRETKTRLVIHNKRMEEMTPFPVDVITARALAPLTTLLDYARPFMTPRTKCLFPKGENYAKELKLAEKTHLFTTEICEIGKKTDKNQIVLLKLEQKL